MSSYRTTSRFFALVAGGVLAASCASAGSTGTAAPTGPQAAPAVTVGPAPAPPATVPPLAAGETHSPRWWALDMERDGVRGISLDRAYAELLAGKRPRRSVVVAVIDGGTDPAHEDLKSVLWTHAGETAGNGRDDDNNGYVDDVVGWNYIGGAGGSVGRDTYEVVRLYARDSVRFAGKTLANIAPGEMSAFQTYQEIRAEFMELRSDNEEQLMQVENIGEAMAFANGILKPLVGNDSLTMARVAAMRPTARDAQQAQQIFLQLAAAGITQKVLDEELERLKASKDFQLNPAFDPRPIVGDNYADKTQRNYGNADVKGPDAVHGTHVAGIIAAQRGNNVGIDGVAWGAQIMVVRAVPDGDERDKDVANAIRYAADNGANVINMSFGKGWSPEKAVVDEAVKYAMSKGVLMVHGAGNDGENLAENDNFPNRVYATGDTAALWIEVGASSWEKGVDSLAAPFSNYGKAEVDVFAPGVDIRSTTPDNGYEELSGTSMASPVVAGVAALVMAYFPELTAAQVKRILLDSSTKITDRVLRPGDGQMVPFADLSRTGGIVNVYRALQMAQQMTGRPPE
jgi:subtilisin family serine protease